MQFQTHVDLPSTSLTISPSDQILFLGSCFATNIGERMKRALPNVEINPFGTLYNPMSIALALRLLQSKQIDEKFLFEGRDGLWHSWIHASEVSATTREECLFQIEKRWKNINLAHADILFITFGTAKVYELTTNNEIVANCHKELSNRFRERSLSIEEIVTEWSNLLEDNTILGQALQVVFTVSPYRYAKYGFHESQLSKARLLLAIEQLCNSYSNCHYFPAYEIVLDELRDYRFYTPDMLHPTAQTADYIWEKLQEWAFPKVTKQFAKERIALWKALSHRPRDTESVEYLSFIEQTQQRLVALDASLHKNQ